MTSEERLKWGICDLFSWCLFKSWAATFCTSWGCEIVLWLSPEWCEWLHLSKQEEIKAGRDEKWKRHVFGLGRLLVTLDVHPPVLINSCKTPPEIIDSYRTSWAERKECGLVFLLGYTWYGESIWRSHREIQVFHNLKSYKLCKKHVFQKWLYSKNE